MKRSAFGLLAGILFFVVCGCSHANGDTTKPANGFTLNGLFVPTDFAVRNNWTGGTAIAFTNIASLPSFTGNAETVQFLLDSLRSNCTYTYMSSDSAAFNKTKNFDIALLYRNVQYRAGKEVPGTGMVLSKPTGGSLTFIDGPSLQQFSYTLEFGKDTTINGNYQGHITVVE